MTETHEHRLKRLTMRSNRRGMKEMDLILGRFAEAHLSTMSCDELDAYEVLLSENDQDLYLWVTGKLEAPAEHHPLIAKINAGFAA